MMITVEVACQGYDLGEERKECWNGATIGKAGPFELGFCGAITFGVGFLPFGWGWHHYKILCPKCLEVSAQKFNKMSADNLRILAAK